MRKKILVIIFSLISVICLAFGVTACGNSESGTSTGSEQSSSTEEGNTATTTKQTPVYQGMVISSANSTSTTSAKAASAALTANGFAGSEYYDGYGNYYDGNGGYFDVYGDYHEGEYHPYHGDYNGKDNDIDYNQPYDDDTPTIEQEIETTLQVTGTGQSIYYADKGDDIYITIKFSNPDSYEILSFVLNGTKYTSYMFYNGSDLENIIVKLNVGSVGGILEYTIDEIKYVDGTEIKDVLLNGDTVVKCGVRADDQTYATVSNETHDLDSISFDVKIVDLYSLIEYSDGYAMAVLYDGDSLVQTVDLEIGTNTVQFTNLTPNTLYQYAVVALYDDLSGTGTALNYLYKNAVYTDTIVLFDNISVGQEGITFGYSWYEGYSAATITQLTLTTSGKTQTLENSATSVTGLLSNTEYVLTAYYTNLDSKTKSITLTFTTTAKTAPSVEISTLTSGQESVDYALTITDTDNVGSLTSVTLTLGGTTKETLSTASGTFRNLLSNNTYAITVVYTYDLNDGTGEQKVTVTKDITTVAKAVPTVEIKHADSDKASLTFELTFTDTDSVGEITAMGLYNGSTLVKEVTDFSQTMFNFTELDSYTQYTLVVDYKYNLNDGNGVTEKSCSLTVYTDPIIEFETLSVLNTSAVSTGETIVIEASMINISSATFTSVVINGETYGISSVSTKTKLRIEIVNDGQFAGGNTELTISQINYTFGNNTYAIDITENNVVSVFINGELNVEDISVVKLVEGQYEEFDYAFASDQIYYQITLSNATEYEVYSVTIGNTTYSSSSITMSSDYQTVYIAVSSSWSGWNNVTLSSISYKNSSLDKTKPVDLDVNYMRLSSDKVVEISTAEQLSNMTAQYEYKYYKLTKDIDLSGYEWANMNNYMYGVFDGNGYSVKNMSAVTTYTDTDLYLGLFKEVRGIVTNLNITGALYMVTVNNSTGNSYSIYTGGIAANTGNIIIDNCDVEISIQLTNNNTGGEVCIGGAVGLINASYVTIKDTTVEAVFSVTDNMTDNLSYYLGGVAGYMNCWESVSVSGLNVYLTATVSSNGWYSANSYFGSYNYSNGTFVINNSTADYTITNKNNDIAYYGIDGFEFSYSNGEYTLTGYYGGDTDIVLPDSVEGNTYTIGSYAFANNTSITSIIIPASVTVIGSWAFGNCTSLVSVIINSTSASAKSSRIVGGETCEAPDSVSADGGIGSYAFVNCMSLKNVIIGNNISTIGSYAFENCTALTSVTIGSGVTTIGSYAFKNCSAEIIWADDITITKIGDYAFANYTGTSITIPASVTTIGMSALVNCTSLTSIVIENKKCEIYYRAFDYCSSLTSIYYNGTEEEWNNIYVDYGNEYIYLATVYYYSESQPEDDGNCWHYVDGIATAWLESTTSE